MSDVSPTGLSAEVEIRPSDLEIGVGGADTSITDLDIFNAALTLVGVAQTVRARAGDPSAEICRRFYPGAYTRTLTRVPWGWAHKKVQLQRSTATDQSPEKEYTFLYDTPTDFERFWTWSGSITPSDARREGRHIRSCQRAPMPLSYLYHVPLADTSEEFRNILRYVLAEQIKPRFQKTQVSADALSLREIQAYASKLIREARTIEFAQLQQPEPLGAEQVGRGFGLATRFFG